MSKSAGAERQWSGAALAQPPGETLVKYMLLIYLDEAAMLSASPDQMQQTMAAYRAYTDALKAAGVHVGGEQLHPSTSATIVRNPDGKTKVLDGPYAEAKEQLAGYYIVEAPDLDAAVAWAARCPGAANGSMEVRPIY